MQVKYICRGVNFHFFICDRFQPLLDWDGMSEETKHDEAMPEEFSIPPRAVEGSASRMREAKPLAREKPEGWFCLTVRDVADRLGISPRTVYRSPTRFGGRRLGGRWRFSASGIDGALSRANPRRGLRRSA